MKRYLPLIALTLVFFTAGVNANTSKNPGNHNRTVITSPPSCALTGTYTIGAGGTFLTITKALDSLKTEGIAGSIIFELLPNYSSTSEIFPITFPKRSLVPCFGTNSYSITLRPALNAINLQITGAVNDGLIKLDSCNYLTIDGRAGGIGTTNQLTIVNDWGTTVIFRNSSNNKLRYVNCITSRQPFSTTTGNIQFVSNANLGSNNNLIENCDISLGNGGPTNLIYSYNLNNGANINDSIVNCNLHEFSYWAVYLNDSARQWKIIGNSFYKQTPHIPTGVAGGDAVIKIGENYDPVGHVIDNNYFGGTGPHCTGGQMQVDFAGVDFAFIRGFGRVAITNNYFRRINLAGTTEISLINMGIGNTSPTHPVYGIISNNQFGGIDPADSINIRNTHSSPNSGYHFWAGFINIQWGGVEAVNNEFNRIRFWASDTTFRINVTMIQGCYSVRDNIIGNPSIYNSIVNATNGTTQIIYNGHVVNNIISNITNTSTAHINSHTPLILGINTTSDSIYNNKIFRITANSSIGCPSCQYFAEIIGILAGLGPGNNPNHIVGNEIHSLINNGESGDITAIQANGAQVSKNLVHSLFITNPANIYSTIYGISSNPDSVTNNMILLGLDSAGNSMTLPVNIRGIHSGRNVLHNTVAIVGTNVADVSGRFSFCYGAGNNGPSQANIKNNIFYNTRSNQSAASANRHYCIWINNTSDQSDYNLFYNTGTGAYFGFNSGPLVAYPTFAAWKAGTGKDLNSVYGDPLLINTTGSYPNVDLHLSNWTPAETAGTATATLTTDFDNEVRSTLSPVDIGADAGNFGQCAVANAGSDTTICAGASVQIGTAQLPNHTYSWTSNPAGFVSNLATPVVSPTVNTVYYLTLTNASSTCTTTDSVKVSISAPVTPSITINTSATTICSGNTVTFTSSVTGGGTNPLYQWKINNVNAGTNNSAFSTSTLNNGDQVSCVLTSNASCVSSTTTNSNTISMIVDPSVTASVTISTSNNSICAGTPVTFTATPVNGGAAPIYYWWVNGIYVGNNSNTFTSSTLNNNDQIMASLKSSIVCHSPDTVWSNIISMSVAPIPNVYAGNDTAICAGNNVQLNGTGGTAGAAYSWSPAAGLSNPNIANPVASPAVTTVYVLTVSNSPSCFAKDTMVITVNPAIPNSVNINAGNNNTCSGTPVTFTATASNGGSIPQFIWFINGSSVSIGSNLFTSSSLNNNDQVMVKMISDLPCASPDTAWSNIVTMIITPLPAAFAGNDVTICTGTGIQLNGSGGSAGSTYSWSPATGLSNPNIANPVASPVATTAYILTVSNSPACFTKDTVLVSVSSAVSPVVNINTANSNICLGTAAVFTAIPSNGGNNPSYQWRVNFANVGSNSNTFTSSILNNNDNVQVILTSSLTCAVPDTAGSNIITMSVSQLAMPLISVNNDVLKVTNPDVAATYTWQIKNGAAWADVIPTATGTVYTATAAGEYRVKAVKGACTEYSASQVTNFSSLYSHFIDLYPNPAHNYITLDSIALIKKYETVEIIDIHAKRVLPLFNVINRTSITIDISILNNGIYMVIIRQKDGSYSAIKFIKQ